MVRLLLLPGTLCDEAVWRPIIAGVADLASCVVGECGRHETIEAIAGAMLAENPGRMAVAGFSFGGFVALGMAAQAPERLRGLGLIGTSARALPADQHAIRRRRLELAEAEGVEAYVAALMPAYLHPDNLQDRRLVDAITSMAGRVGLESLRRQVAANMVRRDATFLLPRLPMPAMVVCGTDDPIFPPAVHRAMADALADVVLTEIGHASHFVMLEQPDAVVEAVRAWLGRVAAADQT